MPVPMQYNRCPWKPRSTLSVVGDADPSDACVPSCALYLRGADPRTGAVLPTGACAFAVLAVEVAKIGSMVTIQRVPASGSPENPPATPSPS